MMILETHINVYNFYVIIGTMISSRIASIKQQTTDVLSSTKFDNRLTS